MKAYPVSRAAEIRALDRHLIDVVGIPSAVLMEHAGHGIARAILERYGKRRTLVWCGPGNNGGDGYVVARHLHLAGVEVRALPVMAPNSPDCRVFHRVATALGLIGDVDEPELIVDAVFGTGQRSPMQLPALSARVPVVAVDVPTGVDADTGVRIADFPAPEFVVTVGRRKPFLYPSAVPFAVVDIGMGEGTSEAVEVAEIDGFAVPATANKWDRGHVGVFAGSAERGGAAVLACMGALRAGAGLVTLFTAKEAWSRDLPPEIMLAEPGEFDVDVLVVGPGLGRLQDERVRELWAGFPGRAVFDADALRAIPPVASGHPRMITPHAGEAGALLGEDWRELERDRLTTAGRLGRIATTIYKGVSPIVSGSPLRIIPGGAPALGTGGSGDVLAGVCGAVWARVPDAVEAATVAAWVHQRAGASLPVGATASEVADRVGGGGFAENGGRRVVQVGEFRFA